MSNNFSIDGSAIWAEFAQTFSATERVKIEE